jgi:hypothetical protein
MPKWQSKWTILRNWQQDEEWQKKNTIQDVVGHHYTSNGCKTIHTCTNYQMSKIEQTI